MKVQLLSALNDRNVDVGQLSSQRQLAISVSAQTLVGESDENLPLNLCLILDRSGSMDGSAMETVIQAVEQLLGQLKVGDRLSVISFANTT